MRALDRKPDQRTAERLLRRWATPSSRGDEGTGLGASGPRILFVTSEMSDFVKAGGLGEVSAALPRALRATHDVRVLIPGYRQVLAGRKVTTVGRLRAAYGLPACDVGRIDLADGLVVYAVLCPELYDRPGTPYVDEAGQDWSDNDVRFARLSLAAADLASGLGDLSWTPDLLHVNDWPSAMAPAYLAWRGSPVPSVLTIHNLAYQGLFPHDRLETLGVPASAFQIEGVEFYGRVSFLKAGIFYASDVTTVSQTYADEITTPAFGCGLEGLLRIRAAQGRLHGFVNGIDESWDPRRDQHLAAGFDSSDLGGKHANAEAVRGAFGLEPSTGPLFSVVSRLVHQKGIDLSIAATASILAGGGQIAVLGRGEERFETALQELARAYPGAVGVRVGFDETEARRLYAGSDFLLMPSRFEPCGLSQMYAQRYGSLPVAHRTGGLADTIEDGVTGFLFSDPSAAGLASAVGRAVESFRSKRRMALMRTAAMSQSFGWHQSAAAYGELYAHALGELAPRWSTRDAA
ncbi:glycogen synthase GlgA [Salinarimonas soli]|uniref:Glycogen synthase n=1 Tax=Salinarimonas soli TaxID=1638099 RepID=A0A5B2W016_9HYPH|nr:glycogen synthase GlgA [Salinarimonas soli]KAA2244030.1 glycogen synthase GlgA [Salinarimonas soli]